MYIDAICLNQEDLRERSQEVQRMADIYSKTKAVTVWLGPPGFETDAAIATLTHLSSKIEVNWSFWRTSPAQFSSESEHHWFGPEDPLTYDARVTS